MDESRTKAAHCAAFVFWRSFRLATSSAWRFSNRMKDAQRISRKAVDDPEVEDSSALSRLDALSRLLDAAITIPGTRFRIGLDGLLGLIPGIGDSLGAVFSAYIIVEAARLGAPKTLLLRMIGNVAVESIVGAVPILGDLFDFAWKANLRNVALLRRYKGRSTWQKRSQPHVVRFFAALIIVTVMGIAGLAVLIVILLYRLFAA
jgi:hypothetical protein